MVVALVATVGTLGGVLFHALPASATASRVGGGAAAIEIQSEMYASFFGDYNEYPLDMLPYVELPWNGSATTLSAELAGFGREGGVLSAHALRGTTIGNLEGNPYAHSTAGVTELSIFKNKFRAVYSECTWNTKGRTATTSIVDAAGHKYTPKVNTRVPLGALGYMVLNEQGIHQVRVDTGVAQVIYVYGIHVHLNVADLFDLIPNEFGYGDTDIYVAFSSCDPLNIPSLSGLRVGSAST
jgi:hypothetical protein